MNSQIYQTNLTFEELQEIGQAGKNSRVFLARDIQLDGEIVIKQVDKGNLTIDDYHKEARLLYSSPHNNIVSVNYGCEDSNSIYLAMPYYKNGSIKSLIDKRFLTVREVVRYSIQFLSGLNHIHTKGLMHFDVKPDNILLSNSNEALLADFGLSKAMKMNGFADLDRAYVKHAPPEYFDRADFSYQYDIYAAGLTIYRMLNGNEEFYEHYKRIKDDRTLLRHEIKNGHFPNRQSYKLHVPKTLRKIVNKAINVDPTQRHRNVLELINELSLVNKNLDWQYTDNQDIKNWTLKQDNRAIDLCLTYRTPIFDLKATKTVVASSRKSNISKYCHDNLSEKDANRLLQEAIDEFQ